MQLLKLFNPAIRIIGNMKYTKKIALSSFIFFLPVLVFLMFGYKHLGSQYRAIEEFQSHLHYNQAIREFFENVLLERGMMAAFQHGDNSYKQRLEALFDSIQTAIKNVDALTPPTPHIKQEWEAIKSRWAILHEERWSLSPQENFNRRTALADQVLHLTQDADVDPDLIDDIHLSIIHLAEILNEHLPALTQEAGKARAIGTAVILKQSISLEEKKRPPCFMAQSSLIKPRSSTLLKLPANPITISAAPFPLLLKRWNTRQTILAIGLFPKLSIPIIGLLMRKAILTKRRKPSAIFLIHTMPSLMRFKHT